MPFDFDPYDKAVIEDPYPAYKYLQDNDPVHYSNALRSWILTRYEDVRPSLNDPRLSADRITPYLERISPSERLKVQTVGPMLQRWSVFMDPPDHTRMRKLLNHGFTSTALINFRPRVQAIVERMIDQLIAKGANGEEIDFINSFAYHLPATVIAEMLGVPETDVEQFRAWSEDLATFVGSATDTPNKVRLAEASAIALTDYFATTIEMRRTHPPAAKDVTVIDHMMAAEEDGDTLSLAELISNAVLLLFAGHETTTNLLGNGLIALLRNPEQLRLFTEQPDLAENAVEEILRYDGPVGSLARSVLEDMEIGGRKLQRGQRVYCMLNAANRDPRQFNNPDCLDITRENNRHIAFGYGIHFCVGAPLARMESRFALAAMMKRMRAIELGNSPPIWRDSLVLRGLSSLMIRFKAA
ncbi:MAG: cytochrome P450 [Pseudomonadota bacterium]|nr:cytochrome P450 [Pseudomonadota bacterium]